MNSIYFKHFTFLFMIGLCLIIALSKAQEELTSDLDDETNKIESLDDLVIKQDIKDSQSDGDLPYWFSFDWFTKKYNKAYKGLEGTFRRLVFVAKCLQVFKNRVQYRMGLSPFEAGINKFSDWTAIEYKSIFMKRPPAEILNQFNLGDMTADSSSYSNNVDDSQSDSLNVPLLEAPTSTDTKIAPTTLEVAKTTINQMLRDAVKQGAEDQVDAIKEELKQTEQSNAMKERPMKSSKAEKIHMMHMKLGNDDNVDSYSSTTLSDLEIPIYKAPTLPIDSGMINWSLHDCFHKIYDQGKRCSQCYVMSSTALAEFYKCAETGQWQKSQFSKNYVFNCAQNFSSRNYGCDGGSIVDTMNFIAYSGVWKVKDWKDKLIEAEREEPDLFNNDPSFARCPIDKNNVSLKDWGKVKIDMTPVTVYPYQWINYIKQGPMAVIVSMPDGSDVYQRGVHPGTGCSTSKDWHSMILVGYGREDNQDYWLFRNSWGQDWGQQGHFKLSTNVPHECLHPGVRVVRKPWHPFKNQPDAEKEVSYRTLAKASNSHSHA